MASGTGEHAVYFAERFPHLEWQPSDVHPGALESIAAWREAAGCPTSFRRLPSMRRRPDWPIDQADAVLSINMVHISPWASALGLLEARRVLSVRIAADPLRSVAAGRYRRPRQAISPSTRISSAAIRDGACGGWKTLWSPLSERGFGARGNARYACQQFDAVAATSEARRRLALAPRAAVPAGTPSTRHRIDAVEADPVKIAVSPLHDACCRMKAGQSDD